MRVKSGQPVLYRNVFHAGWLIAGQFGVRGVYQGLSATLLRNIPANGIFFGKSRVVCSSDAATIFFN